MKLAVKRFFRRNVRPRIEWIFHMISREVMQTEYLGLNEKIQKCRLRRKLFFFLMFQRKSICKSEGNTLKNLKRVNSGLHNTSLLSAVILT